MLNSEQDIDAENNYEPVVKKYEHSPTFIFGFAINPQFGQNFSLGGCIKIYICPSAGLLQQFTRQKLNQMPEKHADTILNFALYYSGNVQLSVGLTQWENEICMENSKVVCLTDN